MEHATHDQVSPPTSRAAAEMFPDRLMISPDEFTWAMGAGRTLV